MILHRRERLPLTDTQPSVVLDFTAGRARRDELRMDDAAHRAAQVLADWRAGRAPLTAVLAALVAPFNQDQADPLPAEHTPCVAPLRTPAEG
jgi:hypothetical protein